MLVLDDLTLQGVLFTFDCDVSLVIHSRTYYDGAKPGEGGAAGNGADRQSIDGDRRPPDAPRNDSWRPRPYRYFKI